jgi:ketosteroid isomerase-like protein
MTQEPQQLVIDTFKDLDALDFESLFTKLADDIETVDELTQKWNRGRAAVETTFEALKGVISDIKSEVSDFNVITMGDSAVVTCVLKQSYLLEGNHVSIVSPTTSVLRHENGGWKFVVIHSIPLA